MTEAMEHTVTLPYSNDPLNEFGVVFTLAKGIRSPDNVYQGFIAIQYQFQIMHHLIKSSVAADYKINASIFLINGTLIYREGDPLTLE